MKFVSPPWSNINRLLDEPARRAGPHAPLPIPPYMPKTRAAKTAYGPYEMTPAHDFWLVAALRAHSGPAAISGCRGDEYDQWLHDW